MTAEQKTAQPKITTQQLITSLLLDGENNYYFIRSLTTEQVGYYFEYLIKLPEERRKAISVFVDWESPSDSRIKISQIIMDNLNNLLHRVHFIDLGDPVELGSIPNFPHFQVTSFRGLPPTCRPLRYSDAANKIWKAPTPLTSIAELRSSVTSSSSASSNTPTVLNVVPVTPTQPASTTVGELNALKARDGHPITTPDTTTEETASSSITSGSTVTKSQDNSTQPMDWSTDSSILASLRRLPAYRTQPVTINSASSLPTTPVTSLSEGTGHTEMVSFSNHSNTSNSNSSQSVALLSVRATNRLRIMPSPATGQSTTGSNTLDKTSNRTQDEKGYYEKGY